MEKLAIGVQNKALKPISALESIIVTGAAANSGNDEAASTSNHDKNSSHVGERIAPRPPSPSYLQIILLSGEKGSNAAGGTKTDVADSSSVVMKEGMVASSSPPTAAGDLISSNNAKPPAKKGRRLVKKAMLYYTSSL